MPSSLKQYLKQLPVIKTFLDKTRTRHMGDWIFQSPIMAWMFQPNLKKQLPPLYQAFSTYSELYFKLTGAGFLRGGRRLFLIVVKISKSWLKDPILALKLDNSYIHINLIDPRFIQAVNEVLNHRSDTRILTSLLGEGDTFIDIGANHGSFSVTASKIVGEKGYIIAVEPQPQLARAVEKSLQVNKWSTFQVYCMAVGDMDGEIELLVPESTSGSAGIYSTYSGTQKHSTFLVPIKRFDQLVNDISFPGKAVIKVDVEGAECAFLTGARETIKKLKPALIIEIHSGTLQAAGKSENELKTLLLDLGYRYYAEFESLSTRLALESLDTKTQRNVVVFMAESESGLNSVKEYSE